MKKKIILLLLALTLGCFNLTKVNAETINWKAIKLYSTEKKVYRRYTKTDGTVDESDNIAYIYMGENPIYCIEMGLNISDNLQSGVANTTNKGTLSQYFNNPSGKYIKIGNRQVNVVEAVGLTAKYGSEWYKINERVGNTTKKYLYYLAAQQMIWQFLADTGVYGGPINGEIEIFYYEGGTKKILDLTSYKNDIIRTINSEYITPNISNKNISTPILSADGTKYEFTIKDQNESLNQFKVSTTETNITCSIIDKATIKCTYPTDVNPRFIISLKKEGKSTVDKVFKVGSNYQGTLLSDITPELLYIRTIDINSPTHTIKLIKKDSKDANINLEGVTYNLCKDDKCDNVLSTQKTDKNGVIEFHGLNANTDYYLQEADTLENYIIDNTIKRINIDTTSENYDTTNYIYTVTYTNEKKEEIKGYIQIIKTDKESNEPLEGITFDVYDINDKVIETLKTDKDGKATTKLLPKGTYYVKEKETLKDYVLVEYEKTIDINENNKTYEVSFENEKSPQTADTNILLVITIAICTLVCAIIIYIKKINLLKNNTI